MRTPLTLAAACGLALLAGCGRGYDEDIRKGTAAIEAAKTDADRAAGYSRRGEGYAEKARYSRAFKLITRQQYDRLFELAVKDHDQAVALAPRDAQVYLKRALAYYFRAYPGPPDDWETKETADRWLLLAEADFSRAVERDPNLEHAYDMRGLVRAHREDYDAAIQDFEQVRRLDDRWGKIRLAYAYCSRGGVESKKKLFDAAIADYEKSVELGAPTDGCECDPYWPLAALYLDARRDFDKSWGVVRAAEGKGFIAPEFLSRLKKESGRDH